MARIQQRRRNAASSVVVLTMLLVCACGNDSGTARVASANGAKQSPGADAASITGPGNERSAYVKAQRAWVACMREHGTNPPDPDENGRVLWRSKDMSSEDDTALDQASQACKPLTVAMPRKLYESQFPKLTAAELDKARRYAVCMRENGAPDFPDPQAYGFSEDDTWDQSTGGAIRAGRICAPVIGDPRPVGPGLG